MSVSFSAATLVALLLSMARIMAWASIAPPFATSGLPRSIKPMISVALALAVLPVTSTQAPSTDLAPLINATLSNLIIGLGLGFGTRVIFSAVEAAGSLIDLFGGFSLAFALDPLSQNNTSVFGRFYGLMTTALVFASPAHLLIIGGFLKTFQTLPLDGRLSMTALDRHLVPTLSSMFVAALQIAGPMIVVLFLADVALGLLNRIAPQLNVFSLSFPLKIILTLGLVGFGFALLPRTVDGLASQSVQFVDGVVG